MTKKIKKEILSRIGNMEDGDTVNVSTKFTPYKEIETMDDKVSHIHPTSYKTVNNQNSIKVYFTITENESTNCSHTLAEEIRQNLCGNHLEYIYASEYSDSVGPVAYYYYVLIRVEDLLRDKLTIQA